MPWRLIVVIAIFAVFLAFITFNLDNRCNISFGFVKFNDVPVFLTVFISFVFGIFCTLPFLLRALTRHRERRERIREDDYPHEKPAKVVDAREARKNFFSRWKNKKAPNGDADE
jgi:uncharacterized integral membrane protein